MAAATSFLIARLSTEFGLTLDDILFAEPPSSLSSPAADLLLRAHALSELRNMEIDVFRLGYKVKKASESTWRIEPPSPAFGMALHYGYVVTYSLTGFRSTSAIREAADAMSFFDFCKEFGEDFKDLPGPPLYQIAGFVRPRLRLEVRTDVAELLARTMLDRRAHVPRGVGAHR